MLLIASVIIVWFALNSLFIFLSIHQKGYFRCYETNKVFLWAETVIAVILFIFGIYLAIQWARKR